MSIQEQVECHTTTLRLLQFLIPLRNMLREGVDLKRYFRSSGQIQSVTGNAHAIQKMNAPGGKPYCYKTDGRLTIFDQTFEVSGR